MKLVMELSMVIILLFSEKKKINITFGAVIIC